MSAVNLSNRFLTIEITNCTNNRTISHDVCTRFVRYLSVQTEYSLPSLAGFYPVSFYVFKSESGLERAERARSDGKSVLTIAT